jgi:hypothetical protein
MDLIAQRCLLAALLASALVGCVSVPKVELQSRSSIKTVTLLKIPEPAIQPVMNIGGPSGAFGLVGGLIQAGLNDTHTKAYTQIVKERQIAFAPLLEQELTHELNAAGYQVIYSEERPIVKEDHRTVDYSAIHTDADAILHVWFTTIGYISPPSKVSFQPWVGVRVRLLDPGSKSDLYFKTFACGYELKAENIVHVQAGLQYEYDSFEKLTSNFDGSVAGLIACDHSIASLIGIDFAKK